MKIAGWHRPVLAEKDKLVATARKMGVLAELRGKLHAAARSVQRGSLEQTEVPELRHSPSNLPNYFTQPLVKPDSSIWRTITFADRGQEHRPACFSLDSRDTSEAE